MSQSFTNLIYHLIFSTKDRRPLITLDYQPRLYEYIGGTIRGLGGINGVEDHVHVLAKHSSRQSIVRRASRSKGRREWMDARCISKVVGLLLAARVRGLYGESIKLAAGAKLSRKSERAPSENFV
jgi:REP element-mobilizing transposase RayT